MTEVAEETAPAIITDIDVVASCDYDGASLAGIHQRLAEREILPDEQAVDRGYVCGQTIGESKARGVALIGYVQDNVSATAKAAAGFSLDKFELDFENKKAVCPQGHQAERWNESPVRDSKKIFIQIGWNKAVCDQCPFRVECVQGSKYGRVIKVSNYYPHIADNRSKQASEEFKDKYRRRAGVEASLSLVVRKGGRRTPYRGRKKTSLRFLMLAVGINLQRAVAWLAGQFPKRQRTAALHKLMPAISA